MHSMKEPSLVILTAYEDLRTGISAHVDGGNDGSEEHAQNQEQLIGEQEAEYALFDRCSGGSVIAATKEDYDSAVAAREAIIAFLDVESNFSLVARSYIELEKSLMASMLEWSLEIDEDNDDFDYFTKWRDETNLKLLNFLVMSRAYTERLENISSANLIPKFKRGICNKITLKAHSSSIYYRIMYELRNFSLHNRLPIKGFRLTTNNERKNTTIGTEQPWRAKLTCNPHIELEPLMNDPEIKTRRIAADIQALMDQGKVGVDIKMFSRGHMEALHGIHDEMRKKTSRAVTTALATLKCLEERFIVESGIKAKLFHIANLKDPGSTVYISPDHFEKHLSKRHSWNKMRSLRRTHISSAVISNAKISLGDVGDIWV